MEERISERAEYAVSGGGIGVIPDFVLRIDPPRPGYVNRVTRIILRQDNPASERMTFTLSIRAGNQPLFFERNVMDAWIDFNEPLAVRSTELIEAFISECTDPAPGPTQKRGSLEITGYREYH